MNTGGLVWEALDDTKSPKTVGAETWICTGRVLQILRISPAQIRRLRSILSPIRHKKGKRGSFTFGDIVAIRVALIMEGKDIQKQYIADQAEHLFSLCQDNSLSSQVVILYDWARNRVSFSDMQIYKEMTKDPAFSMDSIVVATVAQAIAQRYCEVAVPPEVRITHSNNVRSVSESRHRKSPAAAAMISCSGFVSRTGQIV